LSVPIALPSGTRVVRIAVVIVTVVLAVVLTRLSLVFYLEQDDPALVYRIDSGSSEAKAAYAKMLLETARDKAGADESGRLSREALLESPLARSALANIGLIAAVERGEGAAEPMLALAGRASLRDYLVHAWLLDKRYREANVAAAVGEADILLSQSQSSWPMVMGGLLKILPDRRTVAPLAAALARRPYWRGTFLSKLGDDAVGSDNKFALFAALQRLGAPADAEELTPYFAEMASLLPPDLLRRRWLALVPLPSADRGRFINDGDFSGLKLPPPFAWKINEATDSYAEISTREDGRGKAFYASFDGRGDAAFLSQFLMLPPGQYRLRMSVRPEGRPDPGQFVWHIGCGAVIGKGPAVADLPVNGPLEAWHDWAAPFTVPQNCAEQYLWLGGVHSGMPHEATLWLDSVTIDRVGG
jgi:hypothetical protein